jgi:hypothetical protein
MNSSINARIEDDVEKIISKGEKFGTMLHNLLKNKGLKLMTLIVTVIFSILGFLYFFGKHLIKGKK